MSGIPSQGTYFLGRYRIIDEIGLGGMASVHLARVDGLGGFQRWFAIKRIHAHLVEDETFVNMFLDEANVAARISHPNVATVFELGRHDDTYWIAMEYLHGEPLREVMRRTEEMGSTMPPEIACRVIAEAADGLHAAHELTGKDGEKLNLIHRDVTPHNLFVTYEGVTKVVDFGIAKFQDRMASTQAGTLKGKLAYMSPEQVGGEAIDRRTDIFALGVVLWELTTGQRLFRMDSDLDTLAKVQECVIPPPSTMVRGYPLDLEKILMQALAKNRNDRFPTAREFSRALQSLLTRRGLFIASDEVAAYMGSIFVDRMQKREEHLRWASAVSDAAAASGSVAPPSRAPQARPAPVPAARVSIPPPVPAAARGAPRPAAGAPARAPAAGNGPNSMTAGAPPRLAQPNTMPVVPISPVAAQRPAPRGGASYPQPQAPKWPQPPPPEEDDEDRTVQATVEQQVAAQAQYQHDFDDDNDATIVSRSAPSDLVPSSDALRVPGVAPIVPAAGMPARDRGPLPAFQAGAQPPPARPLGNTLPLDAVDRRSVQRTQMGVQPTPAPPAAGGFVPASYNISDPSLPHTMASPAMPPPQAWDAPQPYGAPPPAYGPPPGAPYPYPGPPGSPGMGAPGMGGPGMGSPGMTGNPGYDAGQYPPAQFPNAAGQPYAPPPLDPRAATRQVIRPKRVPAWAVAVGSGLIAIVLAGIVLTIYAVFRSTHHSDAEASGGDSPATPAGSTATTANAASSTAAATPPSPSAGTPTGTSGLFGAARAGFLTAATPPTAANAPDPTPTATATAAAAPPPDPTPAAAPPPPPPEPAAAPAPPPPAPVVVAPTPTPRTYDPPTPQPTPRYQPPATTVAVNAPAAANGAHGYLSVICLPGCDRVEIDGQNLGASPIFKRQTAVGSHRIKLVSSNPPGTKVVSKIIVADSTAVVRESMP